MEACQSMARLASLLGSSNLRSDFSSEVDFFTTIDAFAHFEPDEGYNLGTGFLGQFADLDVRILDEGLLYQAGFCEELVDTALDHVLNNILGLAGNLVGVQRQENFLFLRHYLRGYLRRVEQLRVAGINVHGNVTGQFSITALQGNQYTNAMAVQVSAHNVTFHTGQ